MHMGYEEASTKRENIKVNKHMKGYSTSLEITKTEIKSVKHGENEEF